MSQARHVRPAWSRGIPIAWALVIGASLAGSVGALLARRGDTGAMEIAWSPVVAVAWVTVGALIVIRRPAHTIGRLCLAIGLLLGIHLAAVTTISLIDVQPGPLPTPLVVIAVLAPSIQGAGILLIAALLARFPDGRLPSRPWRVIDLLIVVGIAGNVMASLESGHFAPGWLLPAPNPIGIPIDAWLVEAFATVAWTSGIAMFGLAGIALMSTYRRSSRTVRAQVRWVIAVVALAAVAFLLVAFNTAGPLLDVAFLAIVLTPALVPLGIGIAVLRYRLYDIDRLISRTISYGMVSAVVAAVFVTIVLVLQATLAGVTQGETLAVAASTLVAFALFQPLRIRVQRVVDRRFHRARLDMDATIASYSVRLRDEVDIAALEADTLATVIRSVEPASARLWLRPLGSSRV